MHPTLDQLQKILKLEMKDGYPNKAVIGGLPKMLVFWEPNARRAGLDSAFIENVATRLKAYPDLPVAERAAAVEAILALVKEASATTPSKPSPNAPPRPHPAPPPKREPVKPTAASPATPPPPSAPPAKESFKEADTRSANETVSPPIPVAKTPAAAQPATAPSAPPAPPVKAKPSPPPRPPKPQPQPQSARGGDNFYHYQSEEPLDPRPRRNVGPQPLRSAAPVNASAALDAPLTVLYGIGPEHIKKYQRLGVSTLHDLLLYFPRRYDNYSALKTINRLEYAEECTIIGTIVDSHQRRIKGGQASMLKVVLSDMTGAIEVTFFNQPWLSSKLTVDKQIVISGRVDQYLGRLTLVPEEWEYLDRELLNTGRIVPVYRLTEGLSQRNLRKLTAQVVQHWARKQVDALPAEMVARAGLMTYGETLAQIHFPDSEQTLAAAQHRLAFDELLLLQIGVLRQRKDWQSAEGKPLNATEEALQAFIHALPYSLTGAQQHALADIRTDLSRPVPMNRLLQGDVGSGKTVVAATAMAIAVQSGAQAALMAPTSILAEQHFKTLNTLLTPNSQLPNPNNQPPAASNQQPTIRLLQGSTSASEKQEIYAGLRSGEIKIIVGTHALIEAPVEFANLGVAVVDEQHRFGVAQRAALRNKGANPHLLVMTATPIPRSLALTVYGDLDLSVLDEMPPGRQPIQTHILHANERERGYAFIRSQIQTGHQAFIIFPLVEESEKIEAKAAVEEHQRLQKEVFPEFKLGLLHGRLKPDEKEDVMARFHAGEYHILVSTSVVEVGVDVPNATVMLVEGANRFGLAQLHQFRGRVGRGSAASTCLLVSDAPNPYADERLLAMEQSQDGFYLAEKDLDLRGPGDFLGTRQSGFAGLRMAKLSDVKTIEKARQEARLLFEHDPDLKAPEHQQLAENLARFWTPGSGDVS